MNLIERRPPKLIKFTSLLVLSVAFQYVTAQPGSLDSGFNLNGILNTSFNVKIAAQTDGKLITGDGGNDFILKRYKTNGILDSSFGMNGSVTSDFGDQDEGVYSLVQQKDGKIVVTGHTGRNLLLAQYLPDGSLDSSYHDKGKLKLDLLPVNTSFIDLAIQEDGKIIVSGNFYDTSAYENSNFFVTRFRTDGSIDNSFGTNGAVYTNFIEPAQTRAMAIQKDGKIVLVGHIHTLDFAGIFIDSLAMARYNTDGSLDTGFNNTGKLTMVLHENPYGEYGAEGRAVLLQPDGKIVVGVHDLYGHNHGQWVWGDFALLRFKTNGVLDDTFNGNGVKIIPVLWSSRPIEFKIAYQSDGKILMAGSEANWEFTYRSLIQLARVNNNGSDDSSFGSNGTISIPNNTFGNYKSLHEMSLGRRRIYLSGAQEGYDYSPEVFALKNDGIPLNPASRHLCSTTANVNIISDMEGATYQWQVSTDGESFNDLSNNNYYSGATSATLSLSNIPESWTSYQYRCIAGNSLSNVTTIHFLNENENEWLGTVSDEWENPGNWLCGGVPGNNATVIINSGNVVIHSNVSIANLQLQPGASLTVSNGYTLAVTSQQAL